MSEKTKGVAIGDVILSESPRHYSRIDAIVTRDLTATVGLVPGQAMDFTGAAVAAVQTVAMATASASGTFRLGFRGLWTAPIAWDETLGNIKTAFELISGGVVVTFSGALVNATTITFANTVGNIEEIIVDARLNLTAGGLAAVTVITTTTVGELVTGKEWATTTANADSILIEPVSLADLNDADQVSLRRSFLTRGNSTINVDAVTCPAGTIADLISALEALGIQCHREATMTEVGTPRE